MTFIELIDKHPGAAVIAFGIAVVGLVAIVVAITDE